MDGALQILAQKRRQIQVFFACCRDASAEVTHFRQHFRRVASLNAVAPWQKVSQPRAHGMAGVAFIIFGLRELILPKSITPQSQWHGRRGFCVFFWMHDSTAAKSITPSGRWCGTFDFLHFPGRIAPAQTRCGEQRGRLPTRVGAPMRTSLGGQKLLAQSPAGRGALCIMKGPPGGPGKDGPLRPPFVPASLASEWGRFGTTKRPRKSQNPTARQARAPRQPAPVRGRDFEHPRTRRSECIEAAPT